MSDHKKHQSRGLCLAKDDAELLAAFQDIDQQGDRFVERMKFLKDQAEKVDKERQAWKSGAWARVETRLKELGHLPTSYQPDSGHGTLSYDPGTTLVTFKDKCDCENPLKQLLGALLS